MATGANAAVDATIGGARFGGATARPGFGAVRSSQQLDFSRRFDRSERDGHAQRTITLPLHLQTITLGDADAVAITTNDNVTAIERASTRTLITRRPK